MSTIKLEKIREIQKRWLGSFISGESAMASITAVIDGEYHKAHGAAIMDIATGETVLKLTSAVISYRGNGNMTTIHGLVFIEEATKCLRTLDT